MACIGVGSRMGTASWRAAAFILLVASFLAVSGSASALSNGGFDTGSFSPWTFYSTWTPAQTLASGSTTGMAWSRTIAAAYAHDGSHGLRLTCVESKMNGTTPSGRPVWWCDNGVQQNMTQPCGVSFWFRVGGGSAYFAADLQVTAEDGSGALLDYVFHGAPNHAYQTAPGYKRIEHPPANVWTFRTLDFVADFQNHHGRPIQTPIRLTFQTSADESTSRVDVDTIVPVRCQLPEWTTPSPCGQTLHVAAGGVLEFEVRAVSSIPPPNHRVWIFHTPDPYPARFQQLVPPSVNPGAPAVERVRFSPTSADVGVHVIVFHPMDHFERFGPDCKVTIEVHGKPPYWLLPPTPCGQTIQANAGDTIRYTVVAESSARPMVSISHTGAPAASPGGSSQITVAAGNPHVRAVTGSYEWRTTPADVGRTHTVAYVARDDFGQQTPSCAVTVKLRDDICVQLIQGCIQRPFIAPLLALPLAPLVRPPRAPPASPPRSGSGPPAPPPSRGR